MKNNQIELKKNKNIIIENKSMYEFNNGLIQVEHRNSHWNDRSEEIFQMATWSAKVMKNSKERLINVEDR